MDVGTNDEILLSPEWRDWTLPRLFTRLVEARSSRPALQWIEDGDRLVGWSWAEYATRACRVATSVRRLGLERGDRVLMLTRNVPEFHVAEMGLQLAGAAGVSVYATSAPDQIHYQATHCEARMAIVEAGPMLDAFVGIRDRLPHLEHLVVLGAGDDQVPRARPFAELMESEPGDLESLAGGTSPEDLVTLVYTSGTTGPPKGVIYTQRQLVWAARCIRSAVGHTLEGWEWLSHMPLAHIGERVTGHYNQQAQGLTSTSCPQLDRVAAALPVVRPEIFLAVPRLWEKLALVMRGLVGDAPEDAGAAAREKALAAVGLDRCRIAMIGGAGLDPSLTDWLRRVGVNVAEGYGLTESGLLTWEVWEPRTGSVGRPLPGIELRLAPDGELSFRGQDGAETFAGYFKDPARTAETIGAEGWVSTGDLAEIDRDGFVRIVGRKKEILVTAGGKNVSPANLEQGLRTDPLVLGACVVGDGRKFVAALISLDRRELVARGWSDDLELAVSDERVHAAVSAAVEAVNAKVSRAEAIKRFAIVPDEWLPGTDMVTPTGKVRRSAIAERYADVVEAMYAG